MGTMRRSACTTCISGSGWVLPLHAAVGTLVRCDCDRGKQKPDLMFASGVLAPGSSCWTQSSLRGCRQHPRASTWMSCCSRTCCRASRHGRALGLPHPACMRPHRTAAQPICMAKAWVRHPQRAPSQITKAPLRPQPPAATFPQGLPPSRPALPPARGGRQRWHPAGALAA